ncbi:DNA mismatch repair endonuclease MutL [Halomarina halobia]|uniref:DNA mismatch repair protein MutL n=2 Tax=Halomarina halobia TaxID=3033386 RepID=A0ABD6A8L4_9EURY|nr:DNA mismatch repair endonuclease MutL [Halomarina sp. PSR21]
MATIERLDEATVARIAAGEVVTRPASVVKELVENSLDAGAGSVEVAVENAGLDLIRVTDDGHGMSREDAVLAVERHTTSKISGVDDVERVRTLGFRGEALPSIASVADLAVTTRAAGEGASGTRVTVGEGGTGVEAAGHAVGTTVEVRDLFDRVPARRESLGTPKREFARISDAVSRYALAHPDVRFRLTHDERTVLSAPGTGERVDALLAVYDRTVAGQSTELAAVEGGGDEASDDGDDGGGGGRDDRADGGDGEGRSDAPAVRVEGVACYPSVTRASPEHVYLSVNGRPVRDGDLRSAVLDGYGSLLPGSRAPIAAVDVEVPPDRVDQNVHPAKAEVRFRDPERVARTVERAVREALSTADLSRAASVSFDTETALAPAESRFDELTVIGQFRGLYLLCEADDDLLVVDQHAAHERVSYERLREAVEGEVPTAALDPPATLSLSPREASLLDAHRETLSAAGFRVEEFGGGTYRVTGVPAPLGRVADPRALKDTLDTLLTGERPDDPRDALLADLACHPSLKAGDALSREEARDLLDRLGECARPYACPHGRPTVLRIEEGTLARGFGRRATRLG